MFSFLTRCVPLLRTYVEPDGMDDWITIIIPYYNEEQYLPATLQSIGRQTTRKFKLILVDNGSTDRSTAVAQAVMAGFPDIETVYLVEEKAGQLPALACGLAAADSRYVATCDADTIYPPNYFENSIRLFGAPPENVAAVMAIDLYAPPNSLASLARRLKIRVKSYIFRSQCHAGGYAQVFRTAAARAAGGLGPELWPYVLYDHEFAHRLMRQGRIRYAFGHYCLPSNRRTDRTGVSWTKMERMIYRLTPKLLKDWFFYEFLARRFAARGLWHVKLRERCWESDGGGVALSLNEPAL